MGRFNTILLGVVMVISIAVAVASFFIWEKRQELVVGWGKLANSVSKASADLAKSNGISNGPTASQMDHKLYHDLDSRLGSFDNQVKKTSSQIKTLAKIASSFSKNLDLDSKFSNEQAFAKFSTLEEFKQEMLNQGQFAQDRNVNIYDGFVRSAQGLGILQTTVNDLKSDSYASFVDQIVNTAVDVKNRQSSYGTSLAQIAKIVNSTA